MMKRVLDREQKRVAMAMAAAVIVTILVLAAAFMPDRAGAPASFAVRLQAALRADLLVIVWLAAAIGNVARLRFFSSRDIGGSSGGSDAASLPVRQAGAILQNTLEQVVLAIVAHVILAATLVNGDAPWVALACLFALGRLLFWIGYRHGAAARAFGFAITFYPSVAVLLIALAVVLREWIG